MTQTTVSIDIANKIVTRLGLSKEVAYKIFFDPEVQETSTK